jgi:predicted MFS family arabinose efflux permease
MSEQLPQARGTMLALGVTMSGLGRMIADVTGSALTASVGFTFAAFVSAIFALITLAIFGWGVHDRAEQRS